MIVDPIFCCPLLKSGSLTISSLMCAHKSLFSSKSDESSRISGRVGQFRYPLFVPDDERMDSKVTSPSFRWYGFDFAWWSYWLRSLLTQSVHGARVGQFRYPLFVPDGEWMDCKVTSPSFG